MSYNRFQHPGFEQLYMADEDRDAPSNYLNRSRNRLQYYPAAYYAPMMDEDVVGEDGRQVLGQRIQNEFIPPVSSRRGPQSDNVPSLRYQAFVATARRGARPWHYQTNRSFMDFINRQDHLEQRRRDHNRHHDDVRTQITSHWNARRARNVNSYQQPFGSYTSYYRRPSEFLTRQQRERRDLARRRGRQKVPINRKRRRDEL